MLPSAVAEIRHQALAILANMLKHNASCREIFRDAAGPAVLVGMLISERPYIQCQALRALAELLRYDTDERCLRTTMLAGGLPVVLQFVDSTSPSVACMALEVLQYIAACEKGAHGIAVSGKCNAIFDSLRYDEQFREAAVGAVQHLLVRETRAKELATPEIARALVQIIRSSSESATISAIRSIQSLASFSDSIRRIVCSVDVVQALMQAAASTKQQVQSLAVATLRLIAGADAGLHALQLCDGRRKVRDLRRLAAVAETDESLAVCHDLDSILARLP
eukprot:TRINITY_DN862_c0_g1_i1.p1 TRINITY_DN862_c0_g1~~TRINITY_DN862_c0_g1_i1.p1  ORF type:complete len:279 (+),score=60.72 TRINITY_DN862_c0_g1_i1:812-1648(+)